MPLRLGAFERRLQVGVGLRRQQQRVEALRDQVLGDRELAELVALALRRLVGDLDARPCRHRPGSPRRGCASIRWSASWRRRRRCVPAGAAGTSPNLACSSDQSMRSVSVSELSGARSCAWANPASSAMAQPAASDLMRNVIVISSVEDRTFRGPARDASVRRRSGFVDDALAGDGVLARRAPRRAGCRRRAGRRRRAGAGRWRCWPRIRRPDRGR